VDVHNQDDPDGIADAIAYVCANIAGIRASLESDGDPAALGRLLEAVRSGDDVTQPLEELNQALRAAADALGAYGQTRGVTRSGTFSSGIGMPRPAEVVYLCPARLCSRYWWPDSFEAVPVCALNGEPLCAERL